MTIEEFLKGDNISISNRNNNSNLVRSDTYGEPTNYGNQLA